MKIEKISDKLFVIGFGGSVEYCWASHDVPWHAYDMNSNLVRCDTIDDAVRHASRDMAGWDSDAINSAVAFIEENFSAH